MKKLILTLSIVLTLLTSCKKNEVPEPKPNSLSGTQYNCQLEGTIIDLKSYQYMWEPSKFSIIVQYKQLAPSEIFMPYDEFITYSKGDKYCLD